MINTIGADFFGNLLVYRSVGTMLLRHTLAHLHGHVIAFLLGNLVTVLLGHSLAVLPGNMLAVLQRDNHTALLRHLLARAG